MTPYPVHAIYLYDKLPFLYIKVGFEGYLLHGHVSLIFLRKPT